MRNKILISASIILIVLLIFRLIIRRVDKYSTEKKWYIENLNYNFTAKIDSIVVLNKKKGKGYFLCHQTSGTLNRFVEDSLKLHLVQYKWLRVLAFGKKGRIVKGSNILYQLEVGDSVYVNSSKDLFLVSRNRKIISEEKISDIIFEQLL